MVTSQYTSNTISIKRKAKLRPHHLVYSFLKSLEHFFNSSLNLLVIRFTVVIHTVVDQHFGQWTHLQLTLTVADKLVGLRAAFLLQKDVAVVTRCWLRLRLSFNLLAQTNDAN